VTEPGIEERFSLHDARPLWQRDTRIVTPVVDDSSTPGNGSRAVIRLDMSNQLKQQIEDLVNGYSDAVLDRPLGKVDAVRDVQVTAGRARVDIRLGFPVKNHGPKLAAALRQALEDLDG